jgi:5,10-methylenetetrahydromethanopterin reductase
MTIFSLGISGGKPIEEYIHLAKLAEQYNFHTLSIFDDLMFKPAWPILYVVAQHTQRIQLGPSVSNPYLIHPAILAEFAVMLDEISHGRAYMGIGRGAFLDFVNVEAKRALTAVPEAVALMRHLWRHELGPFHGKVFQTTEHARLHWQPQRTSIPVMMGTWGPKMCYEAGKIADEVKAGAMWSDTYGQYMWEHIVAGAKEAGRDPREVGLVFGPLTSISEDADEAKAFAKRTLAFYLPFLSPMPEYLGVEAEFVTRVQELTRQGDMAAAMELVPQWLLDHFALYGTPHQVIEGIERMVATTHVTRIEFGMPHGPQGSERAVQLLGKHVLPHFNQKAETFRSIATPSA